MTAPAPRPGILEISPYIGGEAHAPGVTRLIRLASNEGALGPSPCAVEAYRSEAAEIFRYPDGSSQDLRAAIARLHGLDAARIVCGAGSDELLTLLAHAYAVAGTEVLYSRHGFLVYPIVTLAAGGRPVEVPAKGLGADVDAILDRVNDRTRIVFLANPNNPTGTWLEASELARLHAGLPEHVILVIDAAYAEYMTEATYSPGVELVERAVNVVMTRTFSKIYALAGLRLGWCYGSAPVIDVLNRVRGPFNVTRPAQAAGIAALEDESFVERSREHNTEWRAWLTRRLTDLGYLVHPSAANFVLVRFADLPGPKADAEAARQFLKQRGILVRQMGVYGLADCLRVTIGTEDEMRVVVDAFAAYLQE